MKSIKRTLTTLIILFFSFVCKSQMAGLYTVPGTFSTIGQAINNINTYGITGPVTIDITAGHTETATAGGYSLYTVVGGSSLNTVTFQKSGIGANPMIYSYMGIATPSSAAQDGIWRLIGADDVTIDGIDIYDPNNSVTTSMEFGYGFFKSNAANGCQNNTIKNCKIKLNRLNNAAGIFPAVNGSRGIELVNASSSSHTTALTVTVPSGANSGNKFYSNTIYDCNIGISMVGFLSPAPYSLSDSNNDIGGITSATSNTITNFGGSGTLTPSSAIQTYGQYTIKISNNIINNNTGTGGNHQAPLRGIYLTNALGANVTITNNTVTVSGGASTVQVTAIENTSGTAAIGNTVNISNNVISGCSQTVNTTGTFYGIWNSAPAEKILITGNTFTNNYNSVTTGTTYLIYNSGQSNSLIDLSNNNLSYALTSTHSGLLYGINNSASTASANVNINNNQFSNFNCAVPNSSGRFHFLYASGTNSTISFNNNAWNSLTITTQGGFGLMVNTSNSRAGVSVKSNSIVTGFTIPGLAGDFLGYNSAGFSGAACNVTITGNDFSGIYASGYGNGSFMGITSNDISDAPYAHVEIYNNLVSNIYYNGQGGVLGIYARYLGPGSLASSSSIHSNTITNIDTWGTCTGINLNPNSSSIYRTACYNNLISNMLARENGGNIYGALMQCQTSGIDFYSNKICNIVQSGTLTSKATGIKALSGTDVRIYNNIIGNVQGSNATLNDAAGNDASTGISIGDGPNFKIYFNTVYLSGASLGSSCINTTNTTTYTDIKNNIFVNLCTPTGTSSAYCMRRYNTGLSGYELTSNNNLFYAGTPGPNNILLRTGVSNYTTLSAMKTALAGRELNSVTENPNFVSTVSSNSNYLIPNPSTPTQIESGAIPTGSINTDFYFTNRNTSFPDIGAVEGTYSVSSVDGNAPTVVSQGFSSFNCNTSSRTYTANLSDVSGIATGTLAPRVYYKINNTAYTSVNGTLTAGTNTFGVWTFNLAFAAGVNDIISYYLVAQDNSPLSNLVAFPPTGFSGTNVNTIITPPTSPLTYTIYNTLAGTYTVGATGTFTTLTAASKAYNTSCLTGPVTFILSDASYSTNETFPIVFLNNPTANNSNSLLIVPAANVSSTIQSATNSFPPVVLKFLDARFITVNGLNTSGSSLMVYNTSTSNISSAGAWLASNGAGNSSLSFLNTTFKGTNQDYSYGVVACEEATFIPNLGFFNGGKDNDNIKINGNTFIRQGYAIAAIGGSMSIPGGDDNWQIQNNQIGPVISLTADNIGHYGIHLQNFVQSTVKNNTICNITSTTNVPVGLNLSIGTQSVIFDGNTIRSLKYMGTNGYSGLGIVINTGTYYSNLLLKNNMICDLLGNARTTFTNAGFAAVSVATTTYCGGFKFYNNTFAINQATAAPGYTNNSSSAVMYFSALSNDIELKNNILFTNTQFTTFTNSTTYAIYSHAPASAFNVMDYNSFVAAGAQAVPGYLGGQLLSLSAIKNAFGQNNNSIFMLPAFTSSTDLHIDLSSQNNYFFENLGSPISGVNVDIDNQSRNLSAPDIGADEFTTIATCTNALGGSIVSSNSVCAGTSFTLNANGVSGGVGTVYQWKVSPTPGGPYTNVSIGSNANTPSYSLGLYPQGTYYFIQQTTCPSLSLTGISNESTVSVISPPSLTTSASQSIVCSGNSATLTANGASSYTWSNGSTGSVNIIAPISAGIYHVTGVTSPCAAIQSNNILVYFISSPTVNVSSSSTSICIGNSVTISASGANSYTWTNGPQTSSIIATPTINTTYTVSGTTNNCNDQAVITVTVNTLPLVAISGNTSVCMGGNITLSGNGANTYTWSNSSVSNNILISPITNTIYSITGTDLNGCINTASTNITVLALPLITAQSNTTVICAGDPIILTGSGGQTYAWSGGVFNNTSFYPTSSSVYTVTGTDSNGCLASANISITVNALPNTTIISTNSVICAGESATLSANGALSYLWSTTENTQNITVSPVISTNYTVTGIDINGCSNTYSITQVVDPCTGLSSISLYDKYITIYPSPNTGKFYIHSSSFEANNSRVEIINELGQLIYAAKVESNVFLIDITLQSKGIYFINFIVGTNTVRKKIIKE